MRFLSYLYHNGVRPEDDGLTVIRITLANLIVLLTSVLILFYLKLFIQSGDYISTVSFSSFLVFGSLCLYLLRKRKLNLSYHLVQILSCYMISVSMISFGMKSNGHVLVPMLMVFIFIFFEKGIEWLLHSIIVFISFIICFQFLDANGPILTERPLHYDYYVNMSFAIVSCGVLSFVLMKSFRAYVAERHNVITEMTRSNRLLEEKNQIIAKQKDELEIFNSMASHDLKGPIRTITSFAGLLSKKQLDQESLEYLNFIKKGSSQLSYLVDGITAYQQLNENKNKNQSIDPNLILKEIRSIVNPEDLPTLKIIFGYLPRLNMNPVHFHHIIQNLVENGLKYNTQSEKIIEISCQRTEDNFMITVTDNGIGIENEFHDYIFEPFKKLNASDKYNSTGLGLSIVKRIISLYDGEIQVRSSREKGSQFRIELPLRIIA